MEMEFRDTSSRRRRMLLFVGVAMAALAGLWAFTLAGQGGGGVDEVPRQSVLVVTRDVPARSVLTVADLTLREVPEDESLRAAFSEKEHVVGRTTTVPMLEGQVVFPNTLVKTAEDAKFSLLGPGEVIELDSPFWRAVSVMVPPERAVGGQILVGQRVDLVVSVELHIFTVDENGEWTEAPLPDRWTTGKSTRLALQDLEVLDIRPDENIYILKVNANQAEEIYHVAAEAGSAFSLALRADGDTRPVPFEDFGETTDRLIVQYLFPVPRIIDIGELTNGQAGPLPNQPGVPSVTPPQPEPEPEPEPEP